MAFSFLKNQYEKRTKEKADKILEIMRNSKPLLSFADKIDTYIETYGFPQD